MAPSDQFSSAFAPAFAQGTVWTASCMIGGTGSVAASTVQHAAASATIGGGAYVLAVPVIPGQSNALATVAGAGSVAAAAGLRASASAAILGAGSVTARAAIIAVVRTNIAGAGFFGGSLVNLGNPTVAPGTANDNFNIRYRVTGTSAWTDYGSTTSLSSPIVGLEPNTTYDVQVTAINSAGQTNSAIQTITTQGVTPAQPTGLTATNITPASLVLNWGPSPSGSAPISYQVYYRVTGAGNYVPYGDPTQGLTETISGLSSATSYDLQVAAENSAGSVTSAALTVLTAQAGIVAGAPPGLAVSNIAATTVTFSWQASAGSPPITYQPQYQIAGATTWIPLPQTSSGSVVVTGLLSATQYNFGVTATNALGTSALATITASTVTGVQAPSAPTSLAATSITSAGLTLSWAASTGTQPSYQVIFRLSGTGSYQNFVGAVTTTSEAITGLTAATAYDFQVTASNSAGSATSTTFTVTTAAASVPPTAPTGLGATNITQTGLLLTWIPSSGTAQITYQVQQRVHGTTPWTNVLPTVTVGQESITGLTSATSYDFQVIATNSFGSATSGMITAATPVSVTAPSAPTGLTVGTMTQNSAVLSWTASTGTAPITYTPAYQAVGTPGLTNATATTTTSTTITGLTPGQSYTLQVTASNSAGTATSGTVTASTLYSPSANGTTLTSTTGTLVDPGSNVWRLNGAPAVVQENTAPGYSGFSNAGTSSNVTLLLLYNSNIYYESSSAAWYEWVSGAWSSIGSDPRTVVTESAQGTTLVSSTGTVYDAALNSWTLVPAAGGTFTVDENGNPSGFSANVTILLYYNHTVYVENTSNVWYDWSGGAWVQAPGDPRVAESAQGTSLSTTSGAIYDANLTAWTLVQSAASGLQVAKAGTVDTNTTNVVLLLYWNHTVYQENNTGGWWSYNATASFPWVQAPGDPRSTGGTGVTPLFYDEFNSLSLINSRDATTSGNNWQPAYWYATDGKIQSQSWVLNPFDPSTPITGIYAASNSILTLTLEQTPPADSAAVSNAPYVGASMSTEPHFQSNTGYFECSASVPLTPGTQFQFWLMQDVTYPPEIDVAEIASGQNSDGSLWQVLKFSIWGVDANGNATITGYLYNYNNPNGVTINPASGYHQYGVLVDAVNATVYWDRQQVGQFPLPAGYQNYKFFPITGFTDGGTWSGAVPNPSTTLPAHVTVDYIGVWASFPGTTTAATVTAISLSSTTIAASSAVGSAVGNITITMSDGSQFAGTLALGGTNAGSFRVAAAVLDTAAALTGGTSYAISITAAGTNNTLTQNFTITATATGGGGTGTGPAASSSFITADFTSAQNYSGSTTTQQVVSQRMWGVSTGGAADNHFAAFANSGFISAASTVNPGVWRVNGDQDEQTGTYWNSDLSVNTAHFANVVNNLYKVDPLGVTGFIIGANFYLTHTTTPVPYISNPTQYGTAMGNLAQYLSTVKMPNGKTFPLIGMESANEQGALSPLNQYHNAMATAVRAVNPNIMICGPTESSAGLISNFQSNVNYLDVQDYHVYIGGTDPGQGAYATTRGTGDINILKTDYNFSTLKAVFLGEYNIDWYCQAASMVNYVGPVFDAVMLMEVLNGCPVPFWAAIWDAYLDSNCGIINSSNTVYPGGLLIGQGVRTVYGPRWQVPTNTPGFLTLACSPSSGHATLMLVNHGQGAQNGKTVAFSHMPGSSTGTLTANTWQTSQATPNGATGTVAFTNGISGSMNFPDPSVTIIWI